MKPSLQKRMFLAAKVAMIVIIVASATLLYSQGLRYEPPQIPGFEPPFQSDHGSPFTDPNPAILKNNSKFFTDTSNINFESRQITFSRADSVGNTVWTYHYGELSDYIADRRLRSFYDEWYAKLTAERQLQLPPPPTPRLQWELALHYPPWAQRLLGNEPPRIKIEGRLQLTAAYERTSTRLGDEPPLIDRNPLDFQTEYDFSMTGSVGRLISVNITHTRQDGFDFGEDPLKNIKVEYKESEPGELEDEIIQEIVLGYTGFDMPGTALSGYSDRHDGLFGGKIRAKFGPLMLTGIASHAQGEALTMELGGRNDPNNQTAQREDEFIRNRYFFLDTLYRNAYNRGHNIAGADRSARPTQQQVTGLQAFVSILCTDVSQSTTLRFIADVDGSDVCFIMLTENRDYIVDADWGWVRFERNIRDEEIVAVAMATWDGTLNTPGGLVPLNAENNSHLNNNFGISLKQIKPRNMEQMTRDGQNSHLFDLMWRNVYHLSELEDSRLDLYYLDPAVGDTIRHAPDRRLLSYIMGITDAQGRARTDNVEIFNFARNEIILPPWGPGPDGNNPFANDALGEAMVVNAIYTHGSRTTLMLRDYVSKYGLVTGGSMRRTTYDNLGWNILEGTVTVRTNTGVELIEGEDYELDYMMGILDLISTRARAAESIFITFQRESDFVLDKKVFLGLRGEVKLPFISENSFMAASVLYQNAATTAEDIPRLGNEPFSKLHLSFNTSLDFEPEWMTKAVDMIPLINAAGESAAKLDFEIVHSRMNPNRSGSMSAYIDDFERTKDGYSVSLRHQNWHPSHYPFPHGFTGPYTSGNASAWSESIGQAMLGTGRIPAWGFFWFTPNSHDNLNRMNRYSVWQRDPHNRRHTSDDNYIDVLRLHATPASGGHPPEIRDRFGNSYASITTSFGRNGLNMDNHKYLEMVVNPRGVPGAGGQPITGSRGKLMVQIGTFSHDQVRDGGPPNGRFDIEDTTFQNRPELLSQFDRGLNGLDVENKFYMIPNQSGTGWDTLSRAQNSNLLTSPRSWDNPSGDRFQRYDRDNLQNFPHANGTWGNSIYDTENIDNDGIPRIVFQEKYYSYEIDLNDLEAIADPDARVVGDWRFLRIPLRDILEEVKKDTVGGGADWERVRGMRLVWYDFDENLLTHQHELWVAGIELVGNYWEPMAGSEDKIEATSISNFEDSKYFESVHNFIVRPKAGEATPEEHSLRLKFKNLGQNDTAMVNRSMIHDAQNISGYDSVSVLVFNNSGSNFGEDLRFVFRFGSDYGTYYEFNAPISNLQEAANGWRRAAFSLQEFSDLKIKAEQDAGDNEPVDATDGRLRVVAPAGKRPNFTAVTYMAFGVAYTGGGSLDEGEIWVNELMAVGARKLTGVAARLNLNTQWSDFLSLNFGAGYTSGDFRTMTDATFGSDSRSELTANVGAKIQLDKFLPEEWGVQIPVGGSMSGSLIRPAVKPQSDIMLLNDDGNPDGFFDMAGDALNTMFGREQKGDRTRAQDFETFATTRNVFTSFEKTSQSENPLIGFTLDRIKTDVSYNVTTSYMARGPHTDGHPDSVVFLRTDTTETITGNLRYDLSPRNPPEWTSATPFENVEWIPSLYRNYKFSFLPSTISFDLAEMQHRVEIRNDPRLGVHDFTTRRFDMRHGVRINYAPIDPLLTLTYTNRIDRDLSDVATGADWETVRDSTLPGIFGLNRTEGEKWNEYWLLYGERGRTQVASARLTPQFVRWMTHNIEYSASYTGQIASRAQDSIPVEYLNSGVGTALRFRNAWLLSDMLRKYTTPQSARRAQQSQTDTSAAASGRSFLTWLSDGVSKIEMRTVNFEYEVTTDLKNSFLTSTYLSDTMGLSNFEFFKHQLGMGRGFTDYFTGNLGNEGLGWMRHREEAGIDHELYRFDQSRGAWSARFSSAFIIPEPFRINFSSVSYGWGKEFYAQPDTAFIDTTIVLPEIRASANTDLLMKLSFIKKHLTRLALTSSGSYRNMRRETNDRSDVTTALELQPLISLDGRFVRWPTLSTSYRYGRSATNTVSGIKDALGRTIGIRSTENSVKNTHTLSAAYEFATTTRLQELKLWRWVIPIQGKTNVGLAVNHEKTVTTTHRVGNVEDEIEEQGEFSYSPFIDYRFTDNIRGQARYAGTHKNQDGRRINQHRFALSVEVVF
jgi:cell surface protein SprA